MSVVHDEIRLATRSHDHVLDVTGESGRRLEWLDAGDGRLTAFVPGSTAAAD